MLQQEDSLAESAVTQLTVIGIGNRLRGDDAIGPLLIDALSELSDPRLELIDAGSDALGILEHLENRKKVILVDACSMGRKPGSVVSFDPADVNLILADDPMSLHGLGLAESLRLAESLQMLPEQLKIIGIEPDSIQFNGTLSQPVRRALKTAIQTVQDALQQITERAEMTS